ncbi:hypothetical protein ILUMI_16781 [Ignelater luminosus]|uniref:Uncharacterized protein n=1 Tax=Ignelater luminosus TaxID=2038154 RepID=A0A8K0G5M6_IGNLU|nr:hypothetical protein ILUMI_16781 [Ignelater luminosus]
MGQKISLTYMSPDIRNEFTEILGNKVRQEIIAQVKKAKHYSIFDSTPDIAHKDQTSRVLPYVMIDNQEVRVGESFIDFIETESKTAEDINQLSVDGQNGATVWLVPLFARKPLMVSGRGLAVRTGRFEQCGRPSEQKRQQLKDLTEN